ncbi:MAG TPA: hypothetical protein VF178_06150 [Gemmatimonadaceae bacterium]
MTARSIVWRGIGVAVVVVAGFGLRSLTAFELSNTRAERSLVRLSWSARPERVERCRRLSDEELAKRPAHMRLRVECEGTFARYLLTVGVDERIVQQDTIRGGGLRHDRPMHVFEEVAVAPGSMRLRVELMRLDSTSVDTAATPGASGGTSSDTLLGARAARELEERERRARQAVAPHLLLDTAVVLDRGQVLIVTYDGEARRLVARGGG